MTDPDLTPDPFTAFAAHQASVSSPHGLPSRVAHLRTLIAAVSTDPTQRGEIVAELRRLVWPVRQPDGTVRSVDIVLTLEKEDLIRRLWRQDGNTEEVGRRWVDDAKAVFYCAVHRREDFRRHLTSLSEMLNAVHDFYADQITNDAERALMANAMDVLWDGHRINMAVPAPAPIGAHTEGN